MRTSAKAIQTTTEPCFEITRISSIRASACLNISTATWANPPLPQDSVLTPKRISAPTRSNAFHGSPSWCDSRMHAIVCHIHNAICGPQPGLAQPQRPACAINHAVHVLHTTQTEPDIQHMKCSTRLLETVGTLQFTHTELMPHPDPALLTAQGDCRERRTRMTAAPSNAAAPQG